MEKAKKIGIIIRTTNRNFWVCVIPYSSMVLPVELAVGASDGLYISAHTAKVQDIAPPEIIATMNALDLLNFEIGKNVHTYDWHVA